MKTSRQRLLEYIQAQRVVSAADLSRALRMTPANARHHLAILQEQGLVESVGQRPAPGKGRPTQLYGLAEQALGNNLDGLSAALLDELLGSLPPEAQAGVLARLAANLAARLTVSAEGSAASQGKIHLTRRLMLAVERLNKLHYAARWEARPAGPRLILGHCPYAAVLPTHPELCALDAALLEKLLGAPVRQEAKLANDGRGALCCRFVVD